MAFKTFPPLRKFGHKWLEILLLTVFALLSQPSFARDRGDFLGDPPPPPPEPNAMDIEVPRGAPVWITLSAYSMTSRIIRFRITRQATAGILGTPAMVLANAAQVKYTPPAGAGPGEDSFEFDIQSETGVSATAEVHIKITDKEPLLIAPDELDFGKLLPGQIAQRTLVLQNIGGGLAEGEVQVPEGWSVEGKADYHLLAGEKQSFTILFKPTSVKDYTGDIEYSGDVGRATDLKGSEQAPIGVGGQIEMRQFGEVRVGTLQVENRTDTTQMVTVTSGTGLVADTSVEAPANGTAEIIVRAKDDSKGEIDSQITVEGAGIHADVPVHAAPLQAVAAVARPSATPIPNAVTPMMAGAPVAEAFSAPFQMELALPDEAALPAFETGISEDIQQPPERVEYALNVGMTGSKSAQVVGRFDGVTAQSYRLEAQTLGLDAQGKPMPVWVRFTHATLDVHDPLVTADLTNLQPNALYLVRLVGLDPMGNVVATSSTGRIWTIRQHESGLWLWTWLGIAILIGLAGWRWRKNAVQ